MPEVNEKAEPQASPKQGEKPSTTDSLFAEVKSTRPRVALFLQVKFHTSCGLSAKA
jgi:hypothetical protein